MPIKAGRHGTFAASVPLSEACWRQAGRSATVSDGGKFYPLPRKSERLAGKAKTEELGTRKGRQSAMPSPQPEFRRWTFPFAVIGQCSLSAAGWPSAGIIQRMLATAHPSAASEDRRHAVSKQVCQRREKFRRFVTQVPFPAEPEPTFHGVWVRRSDRE